MDTVTAQSEVVTFERLTYLNCARPTNFSPRKTNGLRANMIGSSHAIERIRDPLHNLIEIDTDKDFEHILWQIIQTRPFQRLRRIKQLGFSDQVYPGACHSRFMHSLGVFHTARRLMKIVETYVDRPSTPKIQQALTASLVHDLGHGPFSHAFEAVGKRLDLKTAKHEHVSDLIIRGSEISGILSELGGGFANDVADIVAEQGEKNVYRAVVSSQFDADRLDYMQRDRLMTGAQSGSIDFEWLLANIQIAKVPVGVDETSLGEVETFVLGPKANMAAEAFVLGLFQLYPTIYFHKTTRICELLFVEMLCKLFTLILNGDVGKTGLSESHPLVKYARSPDNLDLVLELDDSVVWGSLGMMAEADDILVRNFSRRLGRRKLYKCIDVRNQLLAKINDKQVEPVEREKTIDAAVKKTRAKLEEWSKKNSTDEPRILVDEAKRSPYKPIGESKGPADRINILTPDGDLADLQTRSSVVAALQPYKLFRAYIAADDEPAKKAVLGSFEGEK